MSLLDNLPDRCSIYRRDQLPVTDDLGSVVDTLTLVREDVPCFIQPINSSESQDWQKRGITVSSKVYFTEDPGVDERHIIFISIRRGVLVPVASRIRYEVKSFSEPDASIGAGVVWRVMLDYKRSSI